MDKAPYSGKLLQPFTPVTEQVVLKVLQKTIPKSCDLDVIPTKFLYENRLDVLLPTITNIINTSLASDLVLPDFKTAIVKPLLRNPSLNQNVLKNYSPISNLPFLSKIGEKVVLHKLLAHLQENNLCNPFQSAYRTGHSTETALLSCKCLVKHYRQRQNLCFTLTGSFSCVWYYRSPDFSFMSRNCLWHPLYRCPVVLIIPSGQKSVCGCQQFCFLFISSHVWCSTGLSAGTCAVCFVHCSIFRHHSKSLTQPSAFCRRHPTSKINSTKWWAKPYT